MPATSPGRQAELVAALVADGPDPDGFDPDRLAATRRALLRKRAGEAAKVWPLLAGSFEEKWPAVFGEHRSGHPPSAPCATGGTSPANCAWPGG